MRKQNRTEGAFKNPCLTHSKRQKLYFGPVTLRRKKRKNDLKKIDNIPIGRMIRCWGNSTNNDGKKSLKEGRRKAGGY